MAYIPTGGPVRVHPRFLAFRFLQALFAVLVIATTAYPLSIDGGGPLKAPLISTIIIAVLTLLPILPLTTPLHISQRRLYDPRIALAQDLVGSLFWLASFAALASYLDIFHEYGRSSRKVHEVFELCGKCRGAWRSGVAAAVFTVIEFLLFLFTTLAFVYYYHCHLAHIPAYGLADKESGTTAHDDNYSVSYSAPAPTENGVATEHNLRSPVESQTQTHFPMNQHAPMTPIHEVGHIPYPQMSEFAAFRTSHPLNPHPPTPHPQIAGYSGAFKTSHPPTLGYGAPPITEEREGAVSPPLPPRSPSRLDRHDYGFEGSRHSGMGADPTKP